MFKTKIVPPAKRKLTFQLWAQCELMLSQQNAVNEYYKPISLCSSDTNYRLVICGLYVDCLKQLWF
jgi:hypothetical protein